MIECQKKKKLTALWGDLNPKREAGLGLGVRGGERNGGALVGQRRTRNMKGKKKVSSWNDVII